ncbi:MAG: hypothetical protein JOY99_13070 [Sphingomonadaceae bacterium]|nr:hypothetical protein [Sphingomonadaceae bacterium]
MVRAAFGALALSFFAGAALAAPEPAAGPPPSNPSHVPHQPDVAKPATEAKAKPYVSEWRKAYIAKHGHEPGASGGPAAKEPVTKAAARKPVAVKPAIAKPVAKKAVAHPAARAPLHPYRRCDR